MFSIMVVMGLCLAREEHKGTYLATHHCAPLTVHERAISRPMRTRLASTRPTKRS